MIRYWSNPIEGEIRDDQGICLVNPDTGMFMRYKVAGAYDSNIALLLTKGEDRLSSYQHLSKVLGKTILRGSDLATNLEFHYGLVNWFLGQNVMAKPTTRFVVPYLTLVGQLKEESGKIDTVAAFLQLKKHYAKKMAEQFPEDASIGKTMSSILDRKGTLVTRPMDKLLEDPHLLSGWLSINRKNFTMENGKVVWHDNPFVILADTYDYLNMAFDPAAPAAEVIWSHDNELLQKGLRFYAVLSDRFKLGMHEFDALSAILEKEKPQGGFTPEEWADIQSSHIGFEAGLELLGILFVVADTTKFWDFKVEEDLEVTIPEYLHDTELQVRMKKILVPPPSTKADEIVAICGGMYYGQEAPGLPAFIHEGMHFEKGQALYIIEVMKMFNTVRATFSGTIDKIIMQGADGSIVQKGQPLFKVTPDEKFVEVNPEEIKMQKREKTIAYMKAII
jgi:biotin carboxyl carrier protein